MLCNKDYPSNACYVQRGDHPGFNQFFTCSGSEKTDFRIFINFPSRILKMRRFVLSIEIVLS